MRIFIDTSAFIALEDRSDARHARAKRFWETLVSSDRLVTSNYVVDETLTRLRYTVGPEAALAFAEAVLKSRLIAVRYVDREWEAAALALMRKFRDQRLSFTDCTSLAFMRAERFDAIFAFDDDFPRCGPRAVP